MIEYLRQFRIGEFAIFDFSLSFGGMAILGPVLSWLLKKVGWIVPFTSWMYLTLPISILVHILVKNYTPMTKNFLDLQGHWILKIAILLLLYLGLRGIHRG